MYDEFEERSSHDGESNVVNLPWREPHPILHDGYEYSDKRLMSLLSRLKEEPDILRECESVIREQLDRDLVERVCEEKSNEVGEVHYLPHHTVIKKKISKPQTSVSCVILLSRAEEANNKVLGLHWDSDADCFILDVSSFLENSMTQEPTKRGVIQAVSRIYDPLGFITPLTVRLKCFFSGCVRNDWLGMES